VLVEVRVQSLAMDRTTNTPVVILQEVDGERLLPIWIGSAEARAIALEMAGTKCPRPLTHDLLCSLLQGLGGALERVIINDVQKGTYFAELIVRRDGAIFSVDARPSDSIAVAMRVAARIFADDELLDVSAIQIADIDASDSDAAGPVVEGAPGDSYGDLAVREAGDSMNSEQLKQHLRRMKPEDFGRFTP
jgi:uncharacterized protein